MGRAVGWCGGFLFPGEGGGGGEEARFAFLCVMGWVVDAGYVCKERSLLPPFSPPFSPPLSQCHYHVTGGGGGGRKQHGVLGYYDGIRLGWMGEGGA